MNIVILTFFLSGCYTVGNTVTTKFDVFSNETVSTTNEVCEDGFCTKFKVSSSGSFLYVSYLGRNWLFLEKIQMKIDGPIETRTLEGEFGFEDDYLAGETTETQTLEGKFFREVLGGGRVKETLTVRITHSLRDFFEKSLGEKVYIRMTGKQYYKDVEFEVINNDKGQWYQFVNLYK